MLNYNFETKRIKRRDAQGQTMLESIGNLNKTSLVLPKLNSQVSLDYSEPLRVELDQQSISNKKR